MKLLSVVLDIQTQALSEPYTYLDCPLERDCAGTCEERGRLKTHEEHILRDKPEIVPLFDVPAKSVCEQPDAQGAAAGSARTSSAHKNGTRGHDGHTARNNSAQENSNIEITFETNFEPAVGACVLVPLRGKHVIGFVVGVQDTCDTLKIDPAKLKPIDAVLSKPYFNECAAECAFWLSDKYIAPLTSCVRLFVPPAAVPKCTRKNGKWVVEKPVVGEVSEKWITAGAAASEFVEKSSAPKQAAIMRAVRAGAVLESELKLEFGAVAQTLKTLEKKGYVNIEKRRRLRGENLQAGAVVGAMQKGSAAQTSQEPVVKVLTPGQTEALAKIDDAIKQKNGSVVLLDGVTGSGKTEVYLRAIQGVLEAGQTAIVLVPEISLTPQTVARFRSRFGNSVAVMHSRMSPGERYDQWDFIKSGAVRVVVGARSALFTPLENVALIIIDEEHESTYKQESAPRYTSRDVAVHMMMRAGGAVVLGSATPCIESLYNARHNSNWVHAHMPKRANNKPLPPIEVVDMASEFGSGARSMFSRKLTCAMHDELKLGHKVVMLLNQRGFAKFLLCRDCGFVPKCPNCSTSLTYHERGNKLVCHHCSHQVSAPATCPKCKSPYLKKFGAGTQRVEAELASLINTFDAPAHDAQIIRMDADTTKRKGAHNKLLDQFAAAPRAILLGTQMIAKGLDFKDVTLVGVINADTQLHLPDFRAHERTFNLIQQVAGRAGRANLAGRVIVQTYEAENVAIRAAASYDRDAFLRAELPGRESFGYPPYAKLANILVWGKNEGAVRAAAEKMRADVAAIVGVRSCEERVFVSVSGNCADDCASGTGMSSAIDIFPAAPCLLSKLRNTYRYHILVRALKAKGAQSTVNLSDILNNYFRARKADKNVSVAVDIDPENLF